MAEQLARFWSRISRWSVLLVLASLPAGALAEDNVHVARLSSFAGSTKIFGAKETRDSGDSVYQNMPLLSGTQISTGEDGRAEIEFEDRSVVRVAPNSQILLSRMNAQATEIEAVQGLTYFDLRRNEARPYQVRYANNTLVVITDAGFRIDLDEAPGELAVFAGDTEVRHGEQKISVHSSESLKFDPADPERYTLNAAIEANTWDQWNQDQAAQSAAASSQQTEATADHADTYGWQDLDTYGNWYPVPGVGNVWQPLDAGAGFDPYGLGTWGWYPGYGYTWISGYPWGWTPFRCGGWSFYSGFGWGWLPGGCYGWGGGITIISGPPGYRPPPRPIGPPTIIHPGRHPHLPPRSQWIARSSATARASELRAGSSPNPENSHLGLRAEVHPVTRTVNGAVVSPLPKFAAPERPATLVGAGDLRVWNRPAYSGSTTITTGSQNGTSSAGYPGRATGSNGVRPAPEAIGAGAAGTPYRIPPPASIATPPTPRPVYAPSAVPAAPRIVVSSPTPAPHISAPPAAPASAGRPSPR